MQHPQSMGGKVREPDGSHKTLWVQKPVNLQGLYSFWQQMKFTSLFQAYPNFFIFCLLNYQASMNLKLGFAEIYRKMANGTRKAIGQQNGNKVLISLNQIMLVLLTYFFYQIKLA